MRSLNNTFFITAYEFESNIQPTRFDLKVKVLGNRHL